MKAKKIVAALSLAVILAAGLYSVIYAYTSIPKTYDGSDVNVVDLYNNPTSYDVSDPDGVADIMVKQNLEKTMAANNVAAIVFDFRGYDTLGESFILLTAIAGAYVILSKSKKAKKEDEE
ncbi:MAG: hypothetical protein IJ299_02620 [Oscillospiraceae bacterium]|nr:hypothetical protein [Oscillospiraceae bacterium]